jgi:alanine dehydrogenase
MRVGVPAEIKDHEGRVSMTPAGVDTVVSHGHRVLVQSGAGAAARIPDEDYIAAGAQVVASADDVWQSADLIVKVKEPLPSEYPYLRGDQVLFTYLHLAANRPLTDALLAAHTTAFGYETVQLPDKRLPLLSPMSEVAGRLSATVASFHLMGPHGGRGMLFGGVTGSPQAKVVIIGAGTAGEHAAAAALGLGADVTVIDINLQRLRELHGRFGNVLHTRASTRWEIAEQVHAADVVVGSVLVPGASAPKLVTDSMVAAMRPGSVLVDIAIDQGGCFEGSHPTTHSDPTFEVHDALYYCVANMPGAVPVTSTRALTDATLPYIVELADHGGKAVAAGSTPLAGGVNTDAGRVAHPAVARALGYDLQGA